MTLSGKYTVRLCEVEDGSFVPAGRDKGDRPQLGNCCNLSDWDGFFCHTEPWD